jgi:GTPase SAR1 family protein
MPETRANPINTSTVQLRSVLARLPNQFHCVVWSPDGSKIASSSADRTVRVWDAESGQLLRTLEGHGNRVSSVAWMGDGHRLASGSDDHTIRVWDAESGQLLRTLEGQLSADMAAPPGEKREVVLWDLGGQDEYRLIHQLFLYDTTLALILLDPTRGSRAFEDVKEWNLRLEKQLHGRTAIKLLVGTKLDEETALIDQAGLDNLKDVCGCCGYLPTSARVPRGIEALRTAIAQAINWSELSQTTRPLLFQHIRDVVDARQRNGEVVLLYADLETQLRDANPQQFDPGAVNTVVEQLRMQGVIAESHLETGQRVLILQIGYIEQYAGSLIVAARHNPRGVPALEETAIASGRMTLPGLKAEERLRPFQEAHCAGMRCPALAGARHLSEARRAADLSRVVPVGGAGRGHAHRAHRVALLRFFGSY